jgi:hypothetical protein
VLHLEHSRALAAAEVVVVFLARGLVSRRLAWKLHDLEPPLVHESLDRTVDGRDAEARRDPYGCVEHFTRGQRTTRLEKRRPDRLTLPGLSPHAVGHLSRAMFRFPALHAARALDRPRLLIAVNVLRCARPNARVHVLRALG